MSVYSPSFSVRGLAASGLFAFLLLFLLLLSFSVDLFCAHFGRSSRVAIGDESLKPLDPYLELRIGRRAPPLLMKFRQMVGGIENEGLQ